MRKIKEWMLKEKVLTGLVFSLLLFVSLIFAFYFLFDKLPIQKTDLSDWGSFGDFFGGTINPVVGILTFSGLIWTIILQRREIREARDERVESFKFLKSQNRMIELQQRESTFFNLARFVDETVGAITLRTEDDEIYQGADAIGKMYREFRYDLQSDPEVELSCKSRDEPDWAITLDLYEQFYLAYKGQLDSFFSAYACVFRFIKNILGSTEDTINNGWYIDIIQSQMTEQEKGLFFYHLKYLERPQKHSEQDEARDCDLNSNEFQRFFVSAKVGVRSKVSDG